jgi:DNA (cytosine-5)-methyltransferase 1
MARIIGEVRPRYAFVENSPMLTTRGLGVVLADLSQMGFDAKWGVVSAADVGANHQRERIWIRAEANVANSKSCGSGRNAGEFSTQDEQQTTKRQEGRLWQSDNASQSNTKMANSNCKRWNEWGGNWKERHLLHDIYRDASQGESEREGWERGIGEIGSDVADTINKRLRSCSGGDGGQFNEKNRGWDNNENGSGTNVKSSKARKPSNLEKEVSNTTSIGQQGQGEYEQSLNSKTDRQRQTNYVESIGRPDFWAAEPNVGRVANGVAARVDRLKAIGNGQVPLCAATAWKMLR